jgi:Zn-dependent protease
VFFNNPQPTRFDLHWRMFGVDVRVHPMFWAMSAVFGWNLSAPLGWQYVLVWVFCVFVSILLHEMGHVCMGWLFGVQGHILLHAFGGLTFPDREASQRWQRIVVDFGGCLFQFIFAAVLLATAFILLPVFHFRVAHQGEELLVIVLGYLLFINLFWPIFNLLPIWPLDGGQISREVCEALSPERGRVISLSLSVATGGALALHLALGAYGMQLLPIPTFGLGLYSAAFFALMAVSSFQLLQAEMNRGRWRDEERLPWD